MAGAAAALPLLLRCLVEPSRAPSLLLPRRREPVLHLAPGEGDRAWGNKSKALEGAKALGVEECPEGLQAHLARGHVRHARAHSLEPGSGE